jgi:hypothetical protein
MLEIFTNLHSVFCFQIRLINLKRMPLVILYTILWNTLFSILLLVKIPKIMLKIVFIINTVVLKYFLSMFI